MNEFSDLISKSMSKPRLGILGGGQLSTMLINAAHDLGYKVTALCASGDEPAFEIADNAIVGSLQDTNTLTTFFSEVDVVTYENDFLPFEALQKFESVQFVPPLKSLEATRDKISQKILFVEQGVHSSEFEIFSGSSLEAWVKDIARLWKNQVVFKWARGGYDGKGVCLFSGDVEAAIQFCRVPLEKKEQVFAERRVNFKRELAQISVRSTKNEWQFYPLVISQQENGICKLVEGPAKSLGVSPDLEKKAQEYAKRIGEILPLYGTYAVEFFETHDGQLLANEIAPRVHNSGHFSLDAAKTSQFENHWRGILGLALGKIETSAGFSMLNLLGAKGVSGAAHAPKVTDAAVYSHWYRKKEVREGRKMGHLNVHTEDVKRLPSLIDQMKQIEQAWIAAHKK